MRYDELYRHSIEQPEAFWADAAKAIDWETPPLQILDDSKPPFRRWFVGGRTNLCHNAIDRHLAERADQPALIAVSTETGLRQTWTYAQLHRAVSQCAATIQSLGAGEGDRVVIYMPNTGEAVIAMLACARIGAIHSVVFGGFAAHNLALRIDDAQPTLLICADAGLRSGKVIRYKPLVDAALAEAKSPPPKVLVMNRGLDAEVPMTAGRDVDYAAASAEFADAEVPIVWRESNAPSYLLYTSGTTGKPKGVQRDTGGYAVALALSMRTVYDIGPGQVMFSTSDVGWVVGHSYIVYGPLLAGATTVLYEGKPVGTPDPGAFWRVVAEHSVKVLFSAPTALRAIRKEDPTGSHIGRYDLSSLRYLFQAGERLDPDTYAWATEVLGIPVIDHWWQTETGWAIAANPVGVEQLRLKAGSPTVAMPGYDVQILHPDGSGCERGEEGAICIRLPLPPGTLPTLWGDDARFEASYLCEHPGFYLTGDGGYLDDDGYLFVMGRIDDVINVAGHRLSTGQIEAVVAAHPAVAECAVIGVADEIKGQVPRGLVVLKSGASDTGLAAELIAAVRHSIGAVACFNTVDVVPALPKTRSGKILRKTMRGIADGHDEPVPSTIEDPGVLDTLRPILRG
jgi:propionyl-CoA synthetase